MMARRRHLRNDGFLAIACAFSILSSAHAQLEPGRVCYGVGQPVLVNARTPENRTGEPEILLLSPDRPEPIARAPVPSGGEVDLAAAFPTLWDQQESRALYAQLAVGGERIGPPLVLAPMVTPEYAAKADRTGVPLTAPAGARSRVVSGVRVYTDKHVVLETDAGEIEIRLRPDAAPNTAWNFRRLAEDGFYTGVPFHRIASLFGRQRADIAQTGDPTGTGKGGPGYMIDFEPSPLAHGYAAVSMARGGDPNSAGSQFVIGLSEACRGPMDGKYAAFGEVVRGEAALLALAGAPVSPDNRPLDPPVIREARLVDAPPFGEAPPRLEDPALRAPAR